MTSNWNKYKLVIENQFKIVNKAGDEVPFKLNPIQARFLEETSGKDYILKARQQGFSSLILALFTCDFLVTPNSRSVVVADQDENASELLDRVKFFIKSAEENTNIKIDLKYDSKSELYNRTLNSRYSIGTAKNTEFGRSKTITNLHLSELNFYPHISKIIAGAGQAVVEEGKFIIESTANGFNEGKTLWDECILGEKTFKPLFFKASDFYSPEFLERKRKELGRLFPQEYPESALEAFITSGDTYFDKEALGWYLENTKQPIKDEVIYG